MTLEKLINLMQIERECITRNEHHNCNRDCENCNLVQNTDTLIKAYDKTIAILTEMKQAKSTL